MFEGNILSVASLALGLCLIAALFYLCRIRAQKVADAAQLLSGDIRKNRKAFAEYAELVSELKSAYQNNTADLPPQIPRLRLKIDEIKPMLLYAVQCDKINNRVSDIFFLAYRRARYARAYSAAVMFFGMLGLLRSSKITGFMRSIKMLETYLTRKAQSTLKSQVIESFTDDYFEETIYGIITSLEGEVKSFEAMAPILDKLEDDLDKIKQQNERWLSFI
ncbi:MAG: hypothetical protein QM647_05780 [Asticcacaulis sp.]|uniref:hypothetical protein n=1 Tax=Asticcacaulis sp. TaxID=1872648 RepID=UPI0039E525EC